MDVAVWERDWEREQELGRGLAYLEGLSVYWAGWERVLEEILIEFSECLIDIDLV